MTSCLPDRLAAAGKKPIDENPGRVPFNTMRVQNVQAVYEERGVRVRDRPSREKLSFASARLKPVVAPRSTAKCG
jgi:hypothetical protein